MSERIPVSVFIIALNEADRIAASIRSVRDWVKEVIVIDSGSTDGTQQVAAAEGARVIHNDWPGYGLQKRFGEDQCSERWLLNIDADEVISPALKEEILLLFSAGREPAHSGYTLRMAEVLPGQLAPSQFTHSIYAVRLYDRECGRYSESTVHDRVHFEKGSIGELKGMVWHYSSRGIGHSIDKLNRYSTMQAANLKDRNREMALLALRLFFSMPLSFLKAYVIRRYALQGVPGFIRSVVYAFSRFARLAKHYEDLRIEKMRGKQ